MINRIMMKNVRRSLREYVIFFIALMMTAAFMMTFNALIFADSIRKICSMGVFVAIMIGFAAGIVLIVLIWLISYMVDFMIKNRSREFATYQIMGIGEKQIANLFYRETMLLGCGSFVVGIVPGIMMQLVMEKTLLRSLGESNLSVGLVPQSIILSGILYLVILAIVLGKARRRMCQLSINQLINKEKYNDNIYSKNRIIKCLMFPVSIVYFILFNLAFIFGKTTMGNCIPLLAGFVVCCYLFYDGLANALCVYVEKKGKGIYRRNAVFFLRQMLSKLNSTKVIMGTIMVFFTFAFVSFSIANMFQDYLKTQVDQKMPFDVIVYENDIDANFQLEKNVIAKECEIVSEWKYQIYQNATTDIRDYLSSHKMAKSEIQMEEGQDDYFCYDTYMKISDYNILMELLGRKTILLDEGTYFIQTKQRFVKGIQQLLQNNPLVINGEEYSCQGCNTDGFALNGQNGADFVIVVPDECINGMKPFYSLYALDVKGEIGEEKYNELKQIVTKNNQKSNRVIWGRGTDDFVTVTDMVQVKSVQGKQIFFVLGALSYPLIYIGVVVLCVGITILSAQQLNDLKSYMHNYHVLQNMGLTCKESDRLIGKQIALLFGFPYITAVITSIGFTIRLNEYFVYYTGMNTPVISYVAKTLIFVTIIYLGYSLAVWKYLKHKINMSAEKGQGVLI